VCIRLHISTKARRTAGNDDGSHIHDYDDDYDDESDNCRRHAAVIGDAKPPSYRSPTAVYRQAGLYQRRFYDLPLDGEFS